MTKKHIMVRTTNEIHDKLVKLAIQNERSLNAELVYIIKSYLASQPQPQANGAARAAEVVTP
jgi:hypothetical protein